MAEILAHALAVYAKQKGSKAALEAAHEEVGGRRYVTVRSGGRLLAVYRVQLGQLVPLAKGWPAELEKAR